MQAIQSPVLAIALLLFVNSLHAANDVHIVEIIGYQFMPAELTIQRGSTVRWLNKEKRQFHNVWFREAGEEPGDYLFPGDTDERTFNETGEFPYVCQPHENRMSGIIRVED